MTRQQRLTVLKTINLLRDLARGSMMLVDDEYYNDVTGEHTDRAQVIELWHGLEDIARRTEFDAD